MWVLRAWNLSPKATAGIVNDVSPTIMPSSFKQVTNASSFVIGWFGHRAEWVHRRVATGEDHVRHLFCKHRENLFSACIPVLENMEARQMLSATTIQTLPFVLDFGSDRGEILDKDGQGTGFTRIQTNKLGTEYQQSLIDLDTTASVLKMTTGPGTSTSGSNSGSDNTLVDGLETQFDGTVSG